MWWLFLLLCRLKLSDAAYVNVTSVNLPVLEKTTKDIPYYLPVKNAGGKPESFECGVALTLTHPSNATIKPTMTPAQNPCSITPNEILYVVDPSLAADQGDGCSRIYQCVPNAKPALGDVCAPTPAATVTDYRKKATLEVPVTINRTSSRRRRSNDESMRMEEVDVREKRAAAENYKFAFMSPDSHCRSALPASKGIKKRWQKSKPDHMSHTPPLLTDAADLYVTLSHMINPKHPLTIKDPSARRNVQEWAIDKGVGVADRYFPSLLVGQIPFKEKVTCNERCDYGTMIVYEMAPQTMFDGHFYLNKDCGWMALCLQATEKDKTVSCSSTYFGLTIVPNSDVVMLNGEAHPLKFYRDQANTFTRIDISRDSAGHVIVTSALRDRVVFHPRPSGIVVAYFEKPTCLLKGFGVNNLGNGAVYVRQGEDRTQISISKPSTVTMQTGVSVVMPTTPSTHDPRVAPPTTQTQADARFDPFGNFTLAMDRYKGWMTWGALFGFVCGLFAGWIIIGLIFWLCRRSVFQNWYRGMFKRYRCDASGTTGGATGAAFGDTTTGGAQTIGNTTSGGTTAGGTTTGGGTTTSGGTTTGGTTNTRTDMVTM